MQFRAWFATLSIFGLMTIGPSIHSLQKYLESVTESESAGSSLIAPAETIGHRNDPYYASYKKYQCVECSEISSLVDPNAPRAFIAGVQKGGTSALVTYLGEHPDVDRRQKEINFFNKNEHGVFDSESYIDRCAVLRRYRQMFSKRSISTKKILIDKTPEYMLMSYVVPQRILCADPNAKVVLVLRNPVDRSFSHYNHRIRKAKKNKVYGKEYPSFEEVLEGNVHSLKEAGLLNTALSPKEEYDLWSKLHRSSSDGADMGLITRSLYAIQIRQWIAAFRDHFGPEKFLDHLLILESEAMHVDKQLYYDKVLDFIGLSPYTLPDIKDKHVGHYQPMANETKNYLQELYRPHNRRLHELLAPHGIEISWAKEA
jgi:hypothetical protein